MSQERQPQNRIRSKFCLVPQSGFSNVRTLLLCEQQLPQGLPHRYQRGNRRR